MNKLSLEQAYAMPDFVKRLEDAYENKFSMAPSSFLTVSKMISKTMGYEVAYDEKKCCWVFPSEDALNQFLFTI